MYLHGFLAGGLPVVLAWLALCMYSVLKSEATEQQPSALSFLILGLSSVFIHTVIDGVKSNISTSKKSQKFQLRAFFIDQLLHIITLGAVLWVLTSAEQQKQLKDVISSHITAHNLVVAVMLVFIIEPSSVIIQQVLKLTPVTTENNNDSLSEGGKLIGYLERIIIFLLILTGHEEGIGWLLTGKSILRFSTQNDRRITEYVLAGTLVSALIAVVCGLIAKAVK